MSKDCAYQGVISLICDLGGTEAAIRSPWEGYCLVRRRTCTEINFCSYPSLAFISFCFLLLPTGKNGSWDWCFLNSLGSSLKKITFPSFLWQGHLQVPLWCTAGGGSVLVSPAVGCTRLNFLVLSRHYLCSLGITWWWWHLGTWMLHE